MLDRTTEVTKDVEVVLADSLTENNASGGGDVHGAHSRSEVTINADVVIVADNVAEVLDAMKSAGDFKTEDRARGSSQ